MNASIFFSLWTCSLFNCFCAKKGHLGRRAKPQSFLSQLLKMLANKSPRSPPLINLLCCPIFAQKCAKKVSSRVVSSSDNWREAERSESRRSFGAKCTESEVGAQAVRDAARGASTVRIDASACHRLILLFLLIFCATWLCGKAFWSWDYYRSHVALVTNMLNR